jgi:hypothetical protein
MQQAHERGGDEAGGHRRAATSRCVADHPADIGAEQVERAVREVDVAHQAEHQREAAGDEEVQRRQR